VKTRRPRQALDPHEWAPLNDAYARIKAHVGSRELAARDLHRDLISGPPGGLGSASRHIARDGTETRGLLKPSFWKQWTLTDAIDGGVLIRRADDQPVTGQWYFFVRRADLDKHYGTPTATTTATATGDVQPPPERRKPGPKITKDWRLFAAHAVYEFKGKHGRLPSGPELAQICEDKLGYQPDTSDIAKLFRYLLGD
jgi:hypothetical protein